jgi:hypothetical protein
MRKVVVGVIAVALVAIVAYIVLHHRAQETDATAGSASRGGAASRAPEAPSLGSGAAPATPQVQAKFQQRKSEAIAKLQGDALRRVAACGSSGSATPVPTTINVQLEWNAALSTPELQRYEVKSVAIRDATSPISDATKTCLDGLVGSTVNVLLPAAELPANAKQLDEPFALPLR